VRASRHLRPARAALAGTAALAALLVSGGAPAQAPAGETARLRAENVTLDAKSQEVLLELYALDTRLRQSERRVAALEARSAELRQERADAEQRLEIAKRNMGAAHDQLAARLRELYIEGSVDPLAVLLGAESLNEALSALDGLNRLAEQDTQIIEQLSRARAELNVALVRLTERTEELRSTLVDARAARDYLVRARDRQAAYLTSLRRQQNVNRSRIATLAQEAAQRSQELAPSVPPAPPPAAGRKLTVSSTGYCLRGNTATGVPTGPGVVAVDPAVIPLGTHMYVPGYGRGIAADTGSAVSGQMIDLWFSSCAQALAWGRQTVTITLN
jgi:peptidoglycan DL-endopeptidase CwlO